MPHFAGTAECVQTCNLPAGQPDCRGSSEIALSGCASRSLRLDTQGKALGTILLELTLPAASAANEGWYVIATTAGLGHGHAPAVQIEVGDWLVSNGLEWVHVPLHHLEVRLAVGKTARAWPNHDQ